jgi:hypothetical protein
MPFPTGKILYFHVIKCHRKPGENKKNEWGGHTCFCTWPDRVIPSKARTPQHDWILLDFTS